MRERTVQFGEAGALSGVVTEPEPQHARKAAPAVILSNVGMHTRIGPFRMWVTLARELAARGFLVLRFDQSGFGDSETQSSTLSDIQRAGQELRAATDLLVDRRSANGVVLIGFCSGVDGAHVAAGQDERVRGVIHLDGYAYPTRGHWLRFWTTRLLRSDTWTKAVSRRYERLRGLATKAPPRGRAVFDREYPPRAELAADLRKQVARGVRLLFVWSGAREHEFNHVEQFYEMLETPDLRGEVQVELLSQSDHLFSSLENRAVLFDLLLRWFAESFSG